MDTIFIILGILLVTGGATIYFVKSGKIKDSDGDLIPDAVEDAVKDVKETVAEVKARKASGILTGTGKTSYIPIPVFNCRDCGHVNEEFRPKEIKDLDS